MAAPAQPLSPCLSRRPCVPQGSPFIHFPLQLSMGCDRHPDLLRLSRAHFSPPSLSGRLGWAGPGLRTGPSSQEGKAHQLEGAAGTGARRRCPLQLSEVGWGQHAAGESRLSEKQPVGDFWSTPPTEPSIPGRHKNGLIHVSSPLPGWRNRPVEPRWPSLRHVRALCPTT